VCACVHAHECAHACVYGEAGSNRPELGLAFAVGGGRGAGLQHQRGHTVILPSKPPTYYFAPHTLALGATGPVSSEAMLRGTTGWHEMAAAAPADLLLVGNNVLEEHPQQDSALLEARAAPHLKGWRGVNSLQGRGGYLGGAGAARRCLLNERRRLERGQQQVQAHTTAARMRRRCAMLRRKSQPLPSVGGPWTVRTTVL
jgi:hypothetical protein